MCLLERCSFPGVSCNFNRNLIGLQTSADDYANIFHTSSGSAPEGEQTSPASLQRFSNVWTVRTLCIMTSYGNVGQGAIAMKRVDKSVDKLIHGSALSWLLQVFADHQINMQG